MILTASVAVVATAQAWAADAPPAHLATWLEGIAESAQALSDGDPARAESAARAARAARPAGAAGARSALALGLALSEAGRAAEAASALASAQDGLTDPGLREAARYEEAQALFYAGHPGAAAARFAALAAAARGPIAARARWREADALLAAGSPRLAVRAYEACLTAEPSGPLALGARLSLAAALRQSGEDAHAVAVYRALWVEQPADPTGRAAARALRAWRDAGGLVPPPTPAQRLARASRFLELALPRRALLVLDRLEAEPAPAEPITRGRLLRALAFLQVGRREEAQAIAVLLLADEAAAPGTRAGAELVLARAAARAGRLEEASGRYRHLAEVRAEIPGLSVAQARDLPEDAAFLAAWLYYDAGRFARAAELLRAYARAHPSARRADDARWFEAWSLQRLGRLAEARRALSRLERGPLAAAALYWQGRLAPERHRQRELYRAALREAPPGTWYALLAASRLSTFGDRPPLLAGAPAAPLPDGPGHGTAGDQLSRAAVLAGAGLTVLAVGELRALAGTHEGRQHAALIAQLAEAAGDAELPFRMARDHLAPTRRALRWLYPRAFPDILPRAAAEAGVDASLYLAVMRRESAFRPDAHSGAGAVGLVQLIPPTAERLAQVLGAPPTAVRELERPEVSVPLGARYLALLVDRFRDPAAALAAYNAGPSAAAAWARSGAGLPLDRWTEDVPYRETRRYVKSVAADAAVYRALWEGGALALDGARAVPAPREGVAF